MVPRWDTSTCNGGLRWQVFSFNAGWDYKNSVSNGGFFQMAARLARYTGNSTYADWAEKIYDWTTTTGLIDDSYRIYDGASASSNCKPINLLQWTYNPGIYIYGAAMMYNYTNASSTWETRLTGLIEQADQTFFQAFENATGVMVEGACEPYGTCNTDQFSFKAYLARFLGKAMTVAPYTQSAIRPLLTTSAQGAAKSCSGPSDGVTCGQKWYMGFDGNYGIGQQLSALEVTQALLVNEAPGLMNHNDVKIETATSSTLEPTVSIGPASVSGISSTSAMGTASATTSTSGESSTFPISETSPTSNTSPKSSIFAESSTSPESSTPNASNASNASNTSAMTTSNTSAMTTSSISTMTTTSTSAPTTSARLTTSTAAASSTGAGVMNSAAPRIGALIGGAWMGAAVLL
jgi:mannan endo-1,6-alpha-mannosidase